MQELHDFKQRLTSINNTHHKKASWKMHAQHVAHSGIVSNTTFDQHQSNIS
jgi:hypothetical protein